MPTFYSFGKTAKSRNRPNGQPLPKTSGIQPLLFIRRLKEEFIQCFAQHREHTLWSSHVANLKKVVTVMRETLDLLYAFMHFSWCPRKGITAVRVAFRFEQASGWDRINVPTSPAINTPTNLRSFSQKTNKTTKVENIVWAKSLQWQPSRPSKLAKSSTAVEILPSKSVSFPFRPLDLFVFYFVLFFLEFGSLAKFCLGAKKLTVPTKHIRDLNAF